MKNHELKTNSVLAFCSCLLISGMIKAAETADPKTMKVPLGVGVSPLSSSNLTGMGAGVIGGATLKSEQVRGSLPAQRLDMGEGGRDNGSNPLKMSGAGRNGPDQSGVSIPVTLDRGITVSQFRKMKIYCDRQMGPVILAQLLRQVPKDVMYTSIAEGNFTFLGLERDLIFKINEKVIDLKFQVPWELDKRSDGLFTFNALGEVERRDIDKIPKYEVEPEVARQIIEASKKRSNFRGGLLLMTHTQQDSFKFGELGNYKEVEKFVISYEVYESPIWKYVTDEIGRPISGPNFLDYKFVTKLKLSAEDYVQCLQNQIQ